MGGGDHFISAVCDRSDHPGHTLPLLNRDSRCIDQRSMRHSWLICDRRGHHVDDGPAAGCIGAAAGAARAVVGGRNIRHRPANRGAGADLGTEAIEWPPGRSRRRLPANRACIMPPGSLYAITRLQLEHAPVGGQHEGKVARKQPKQLRVNVSVRHIHLARLARPLDSLITVRGQLLAQVLLDRPFTLLPQNDRGGRTCEFGEWDHLFLSLHRANPVMLSRPTPARYGAPSNRLAPAHVYQKPDRG